MAITWLTPADLGVATTGAWTDVDVSASVPAGSTGVILHIVNTTSTEYNTGVRKNGSTDDRHTNIRQNSHTWQMIGVDANRVFEYYIGNAGIDIYLVGYIDSSAVFFTNAVDKSLSTTNAWTDIDISAATGADTAIGAIFEIRNNFSGNFGLRKNGSTDARINRLYAGTSSANFTGAIVGVDASEICEGYAELTYHKIYLVGYFKSDAVFNTNAIDLSLASYGAWMDLAALPTGATGGFIEVPANNVGSLFGLRENGSAEDIYKYAVCHSWGIVKGDANRVIEGKAADAACDFFLVGYAEAGTLEKSGTAIISGKGTNTATGNKQGKNVVSISSKGSITITSLKGAKGIASISGAGTITVSTLVSKYNFGIVTISGKCSITITSNKGARSPPSISGKGQTTSQGIKNAYSAITISGNGNITASGSSAEGVIGQATVSGKGLLQSSGVKHAFNSCFVSGKGAIIASGASEVVIQGEAIVSGKGNIQSNGIKNTFTTINISSNGNIATALIPHKSGQASISSKGNIIVLGKMGYSGTTLISGNGSITTQGKKQGQSSISLSEICNINVVGITNRKGTPIVSGKGHVVVRGQEQGALSLSNKIYVSASSDSEIVLQGSFKAINANGSSDYIFSIQGGSDMIETDILDEFLYTSSSAIFIFTVVDNENIPIDLSAATVVFELRKSRKLLTSALITKSSVDGDVVIGGESKNIATINLTVTDTKDLEADSTYLFELKMKDFALNHIPLAQGTIKTKQSYIVIS